MSIYIHVPIRNRTAQHSPVQILPVEYLAMSYGKWTHSQVYNEMQSKNLGDGKYSPVTGYIQYPQNRNSNLELPERHN